MMASELIPPQTNNEEWRIDEHLRNGMHVLVLFRPNDTNPIGQLVLHKDEVEQWRKLIKTLNSK